MLLLSLDRRYRARSDGDLSYAGTDEGGRRLELDLKDKRNIVVNPAFAHNGRIWLQNTAQVYKPSMINNIWATPFLRCADSPRSTMKPAAA